MTTQTQKSPDGRLNRMLGLAIAGTAVLALVLATGLSRTKDRADGEPAASEATPVAVEAPAADEGGGDSALEWADRVLTGGPGAAREVAVSPDGNRVLAVRERGVDLWTIHGKRMAWLAIDGDRVNGAGWSTDGSRVIVWGGETVRLWNADSGAMIGTLQAGMGPVAHAELLPDGIHALTLGADGTRREWDLASGAVQHIERGVTAQVDPGGASAADANMANDGQRVYVDAGGVVRIQRAL